LSDSHLTIFTYEPCAQKLDGERGHVASRSQPSDRARERPRACEAWFCFQKNPQTLVESTRSPGLLSGFFLQKKPSNFTEINPQCPLSLSRRRRGSYGGAQLGEVALALDHGGADPPPGAARRGPGPQPWQGEVAPARLLPGKGAARWVLGARRLHRRDRLLPRCRGARAGWTPTPSRATTSSELEVAAGGCGRRFPSRHCCSSWLRYRRAISFLMFIDL